MPDLGKLRPKIPPPKGSSPKGPPSGPGVQRLLIVEDNPTDRELMRYLLEARFKEAQILEAATLHEALAIMGNEMIECVILDIQLPDSTGKATFSALYDRYPDVAYIVTTHNKDRALAIEMIQLGAADYVIKNFTDEEELFRRIIFAIEKHKTSVRVTPDDAATIHRLDRAQANLKSAHQSGQHSAIRDTSVEVTAAIAEMSRRMFAEMQTLTTTLTTQVAQFGAVAKTVDYLNQELFIGTPGRSSMRSQVELLDHRLKTVEEEMERAKEKKEDAEKTQRLEAVQLTTSRLSNRTKLILGLLSLVGIIAGAIATYEAAIHKPSDPAPTPVAAPAADKKPPELPPAGDKK